MEESSANMIMLVHLKNNTNKTISED